MANGKFWAESNPDLDFMEMLQGETGYKCKKPFEHLTAESEEWGNLQESFQVI